MKNKKGFSLIELLLIIVMLSVLIIIAIPSVKTLVEKFRRSQIFFNIDSIVNNVANVNFDGAGNCWYRISKDNISVPSGISDLEIFIFRNNSKYSYGVYALDEQENIIINTSDFKSLSAYSSSNWIDETNSLDYYLGIETYDISNLLNTNFCKVLEERE